MVSVITVSERRAGRRCWSHDRFSSVGIPVCLRGCGAMCSFDRGVGLQWLTKVTASKDAAHMDLTFIVCLSDLGIRICLYAVIKCASVKENVWI